LQSLSQFNLPVSVPNTQGLGIQNEGGTGSASKSVPAKEVKSGVASDAVKLNGTTTSAVADADVYDPDQPLWNNDHPEASCAGFVHTEAGMWNPESSGYEMGQDHSNQVFATDGSQGLKSSVWGRIASKRKSGASNTAKITSTGTTGNQKSDYDEMAPSTAAPSKSAAAKDTNGQSNSRIYGDVGRQSNRAAHKASRTLYVHGIPQESNRWEALLSHFQKFGQVIDIYIPSNSEKAFVQFSKREEAEAALKAPDAVMGNRFIRLWWANRDRIPDEGEGRVPAKSSQLSTTLANSAPQPSYPNRVKENVQLPPRPSSGSSAEPLSSGTGSKMLSTSSIKPIPNAPKRHESLELLEELRKKQEILAQKRDEFRRQLEKLAKQVLTFLSLKWLKFLCPVIFCC
jgi:RNA-binding protein 26